MANKLYWRPTRIVARAAAVARRAGSSQPHHRPARSAACSCRRQTAAVLLQLYPTSRMRHHLHYTSGHHPALHSSHTLDQPPLPQDVPYHRSRTMLISLVLISWLAVPICHHFSSWPSMYCFVRNDVTVGGQQFTCTKIMANSHNHFKCTCTLHLYGTSILFIHHQQQHLRHVPQSEPPPMPPSIDYLPTTTADLTTTPHPFPTDNHRAPPISPSAPNLLVA